MRARHVGSGCLDLWYFHVMQLGGGPSEQEAGVGERVCSQIKHIVIWFLTLTSSAVSSWAKDKDAGKKAVLSVLGHMPNLDKPGKLCLPDEGGWGEFGFLPCFLYCHPCSGHRGFPWIIISVSEPGSYSTEGRVGGSWPDGKGSWFTGRDWIPKGSSIGVFQSDTYVWNENKCLQTYNSSYAGGGGRWIELPSSRSSRDTG